MATCFRGVGLINNTRQPRITVSEFATDILFSSDVYITDSGYGDVQRVLTNNTLIITVF
jgi:hypothetical protein